MRAILVAMSCTAAFGGCDDPSVVGGPNAPTDSIPPVAQILGIQPGNTVVLGTVVNVNVQASDAEGLASVDAVVSGAIAFGFPTVRPGDTLFIAQFPIPTIDAMLGTATFRLTARDSAQNVAVDSVQFSIVPPAPPN